MRRRVSLIAIIMLLGQTFLNTFGAVVSAVSINNDESIFSEVNYLDENEQPVDLDAYTGPVIATVDWSVEGKEITSETTEEIQLNETVIYEEQTGNLIGEEDTTVGTYQVTTGGKLSVQFNEAIESQPQAKNTLRITGRYEAPVPETQVAGETAAAEGTEEDDSSEEASGESDDEDPAQENDGEETNEDDQVIEEEQAEEVEEVAEFFDIAPLTELEGSFISGFKFELIGPEGPISVGNGETVEIDPTTIEYMNLGYDFEFPHDMDIHEGDTFEISLPDVVNVPARTGSVQPTNGPLVNYEVTADGRILFTFTDDWNIDDRLMHLDLQANIDVEIFEEKREVEVKVPYVDGEEFHAVLVGSRDGVEGADVKTGNTFNSENEETNFRPEYAEWTIRVNDNLKSYENASVVDTISTGHTLAEDSIEIYRIPRNYLTGEVTGEPVLIDPSEYTSSSDASSFTIGFGSIEDTYEIRYRTNIDYETVESNTTINNTARIILDGNETELDHSIDLEWGNDFDPIIKSGAVNSNDRTRINWEVRYNFASHSLGEVTLTDIIDTGTVDLSTVEVFEVGVDGNGNPTGWNNIEEFTSDTVDGTTVINIPNSNGKSYVIRFASDVPGNYVGEVKNTIDDNNPNTPPGEDIVEVDTRPGGNKSGKVQYGEDGVPYIEWTVQFNTNKVVFDGFEFTDTFNDKHLELVQDSFVLTHSGGATLTQGKDYYVTPSTEGFTFKLEGSSEKEVYTLTYRTNYTTEGLKQENASNTVDWDWDGNGIGPEVEVGHPVAGINKTGNYVVGKDDNGVNRQEISWKIEFNTNKLVLETPKLVDTFEPTELEIVAGPFKITTANTTLVEGIDYHFTRTADGFEVQFINNSLPQVYVVEYHTTIPAGNDVSSTNTVQLEWQGHKEKDKANVDMGKNTPGSYKNGSTVAYEEDGVTLKKNEWDIRFNTNKRIIQNLVLTDTYSPGKIVNPIVITDIDNGSHLVEGTDYTISYIEGQFVVKFEKQTEPVEYSLTYSTSYNAIEDQEDAKNEYTIKFLGGTEEGSKTIPKPMLNVQKASTGVTGVSIDEEGKITPAVISWEITGNTDGPNYVHLINAVFEDTIQSDQRYVEGSMKLNGEPITPTWTGTPEENNYTFTVKLPNGAAEHTLTYETVIYNFQSNDVNDPSRYHNTVDLINFKGGVGGSNEEKVSASSSARYFSEHKQQNPSKTGKQDPEDDLIKWEAIVNANKLPIKNGTIRDILDEHLEYVVAPEVYAVINGVDVLVPENDYTYAETEVDGKPAFTITFNGPTEVTPNEIENGIHYTYKLKYNTSLREDIIGTRWVSNRIQVLGYDFKVIEETVSESTYSEKWYFGGGGSSRTLTMKFSKVDADNGTALNGVTFELHKVAGPNNTPTLVTGFETLTDGYHELVEQRSGRYILTEKTTLPNYILGDPVYFILGYAEDGATVLDITDSNFANPVRIDNDVLSVENERQKTNITANKIWVGENPHPTIWFKLFRQAGDNATEEVQGAELKELAPGTTQVVWNGVDAKNPEGIDYTYSVQEVDAEGNEFTPTGYTKVEDGLTVTNTATPIEVSVTKVWDDGNDQDGLRKTSVEVELIENGSPTGNTVVLSKDKNWSHIFENLPAYRNGTLIDYSVVELNVPEEYVSTVDRDDNGNLIVTNTYTPAVTGLTINKAWDDGDDQDGLRPESIEVQLMAGKESIGEPVELTAETGWTHTWSNLPMNETGEPIEYSVVESKIPAGYEATTSEIVDGVVTITNTHTPAVVNIPVSKVWEDADNQDGVRPETITANLLADGDPIGNIELSADNEWTHTFENLPVYNDGSIINYTVTEDTVEGYSTMIEGTVAEGFVITNSYTPEETSVTVTKNWQDSNNQDGNRPESIEVQLTANGEAVGKSIELNAENNWTHTWSELALNEAGISINYSVVESNVATGYEVTINDEDHGNIIVTNTYTPAVTNLTVNKVWDDANNQDGIRTDDVAVQLIADNEKIGEPITLKAEKEWTHTWTALPVNASGEAIEYSVIETNVPEGYEVTVSEIVDGTITVTNTHEPELTNIPVTKVWNDASNQDGIRPESIMVNLLKDGELFRSAEVTADDNEEWSYVFEDLPVYTNGKEIVYTVSEDEIPGYTAEYDGMNIINIHVPEVIMVSGNKTWDDANNQDGIRPESITVNLLANGLLIDSVKVTADEEWAYSFTNLPKFENGKEILYTVTENSVENYTPEINGHDITNSYTPGETSVTVTKAWDDNNDKAGFRPDSIEVQLYADGEAIEEPVLLSEANEWTHTWTELAAKANGEDIVYTVSEVTIVESYTTTINDSDKGNVILTNTYTPAKVSVGDYVWFDENNDGLQDKTDIPVKGVVLTIVDEKGNPVTDVYGDLVKPTTTDENGFYIFENLPINHTYTVKIDREASKEVLKGYMPTLHEVGDDNSVDSSTWETTSRHLTKDKEHDPTLDFGFVKIPKVSVGDYVWIDENRDGLQDETDTPIPGVVLEIVDEEGNPVTDIYGNPVGPTTTDENGHYIFENLPIDKTYTVKIDREASKEALKNYVPTLEEEGDDRSKDSSTWEATSEYMDKDGKHDPTLDFGFVIPKVSVGDYVWIDVNKDGLQDETDIPLEGIVLTIEDEEGKPVTDVYGNPVGPTKTDENGFYIFENLPIDHTYTVRIDREASAKVLEGYVPTLKEVGLEISIDSSTWEATSRHLIENGEHDPTLDFGFVLAPVEPVDPEEPGVPVDPEEPTEPTDPVDPEEPTEPTNPVDPEEPTEPTNPVDPEEPTEPTVPVDPEESTEPAKPEAPKAPGKEAEEKPIKEEAKSEELPYAGREASIISYIVGSILTLSGLGILFVKNRKKQED